MAPFLTEAVKAAWGQKSLKWWIRHKCPLLRKPLSISFWKICQNICSSQVFTFYQFLMVDPVIFKTIIFLKQILWICNFKMVLVYHAIVIFVFFTKHACLNHWQEKQVGIQSNCIEIACPISAIGFETLAVSRKLNRTIIVLFYQTIRVL